MKSGGLAIGAAFLVLVWVSAGSAAKDAAPSPAPADPFLGEYVGKYTSKNGAINEAEAKVFPAKDAHRVVLIIRSAKGDAKAERMELQGAVRGRTLAVTGLVKETEWTGAIEGKRLTVEAKGDAGGKFDLKHRVRKSPTQGQKPPEAAIVLLPFEPGKPPPLHEWTNKNWKPTTDGSMQVAKGDSRTNREFGDFRLHLEFMTPYLPNKSGQGRGNSGVYVHDRYELQVLDSFGLVPRSGDCGGLYGVAAPKVNACLPPGRWQTYDITFRAPRFDDEGKKVHNAVITVLHNGVRIHENQEIPRPTGGARGEEGPVGPIRLQDHGHPVRYRNIWVVEPEH